MHARHMLICIIYVVLQQYFLFDYYRILEDLPYSVDLPIVQSCGTGPDIHTVDNDRYDGYGFQSVLL